MQTVYDSFQECYSSNIDKIATKTKKGRILQLYHFDLKSDLNLVAERLEFIFKENPHLFKINLAFGYIIKTVTHEQYRFYHLSNNVSFLPSPKLIQNSSDKQSLLDMTTPDNIREFVFKSTLASNWVVFSIVCFSARVYVMETPQKHTMNLRSSKL